MPPENGYAVIKFWEPDRAGKVKRFIIDGNAEANSGEHFRLMGGGAYVATTNAIDAIRILAGSGNISLEYQLIGHMRT